MASKDLYLCQNLKPKPISLYDGVGEQELGRSNIQRTGEVLNCLITENQTKMLWPQPLVQPATVGPSS